MKSWLSHVPVMCLWCELQMSSQLSTMFSTINDVLTVKTRKTIWILMAVVCYRRTSQVAEDSVLRHLILTLFVSDNNIDCIWSPMKCDEVDSTLFSQVSWLVRNTAQAMLGKLGCWFVHAGPPDSPNHSWSFTWTIVFQIPLKLHCLLICIQMPL